MATIGTFCHEFSHILGLPDFYNTSSGSGLTPGSMSLMDRGIIWTKVDVRPGYAAFEKEQVGWLEIPTLEISASVTLEPLNRRSISTGKLRAFKITVPGTQSYYYFENRQAENWDQFLPGTGLLIYHVDKTDEKSWNENRVNTNYLHPKYQLIRSGGKYETDYKAIPFPDKKGVNAFTSTETNPINQALFELGI